MVTFFALPSGKSQEDLFKQDSELFTNALAKMKFKVDPYHCILGEHMTSTNVRLISYWYSMWSHRRNGLWKGFLQVNLSLQEDEAALKVLEMLKRKETI